MARKTNKTSHVLNLITNGEPEIVADQPEEAPAAPAPAAPAPSAAAPAAPVVPAPAPAAPETKVTVVNADKENSAVEEEIQKKLLEALEKEEQEAQRKAEAVAKPEPVPVEEPVITPEPEPVAAPEPEPVKEPEPPEAPKPVSEIQQPVLPSEPEESYHMINVMETILSRTDILKYMKEHGGCLCSRCRADVYALVLTRLPSKYVVVDHSATNPMLSYYESKYRMRILTEIIKSCADVKENPRH